MADNYYDNSWTEKVTLPVKRVLGNWVFLYGGDIPVKEGSIGELTLCTQDITDDKFKQRVTQEVIVRILNEGTELCVALSAFHDTHLFEPRCGKVPVLTKLG